MRYVCALCAEQFASAQQADPFGHACEAPPPENQDLRTRFDVLPLKRALEYVVAEAMKHRADGHDDHFVAVGRIAQAALTWQELDERGLLEEASKWLLRIPH